MPVKKLISLLAVSLFCAGCTPGREIWKWPIVRNVRYESKYFTSERQIRRHEYQLARQAWRSYEEARPDTACEPDFARGFRDGFAGYLHTGSMAPPCAAERYRWFQGDGPTGHRAADTWLAGYRVGAGEAAGSGYRETLIVPSSWPAALARKPVFARPAAAVPLEVIPAPAVARPPSPLPDELLPRNRVPLGAAPEAVEPQPVTSHELPPMPDDVARAPGNPFRPPTESLLGPPPLQAVGFESFVSDLEEPQVLPESEPTR